MAVKVRVLTTLSTVEVELGDQRASGVDPEDLLAQAQLIAAQLAEPEVAFAVDNALALQALRHGDHGPPTALTYGRILWLRPLSWPTGHCSPMRLPTARCPRMWCCRRASWGRPPPDRANEALGLTRVLLQLGAQCVVAGVAQVADERAVTVMADYYRRLAAGEESAAALASATASGPYVPFVCFGSSWRADPGGVRSSFGSDGERPGSRPLLR